MDVKPIKEMIAAHFQVPLDKVWKGNCDLGGGIWRQNWVVDLPTGLFLLGEDSTAVKKTLATFITKVSS